MKIKGENLLLVISGLHSVLRDLHNTIVTCPDEVEFEERLAELEAEQDKIQKLVHKCELSYEKEISK